MTLSPPAGIGNRTPEFISTAELSLYTVTTWGRTPETPDATHLARLSLLRPDWPAVRRPGPRRRVRSPLAGWQQVSCGDGSKGPRYYDWALITTTSPDRHLLVRRCLTPDAIGKRELAFFTYHAPACTALAELVRVAGTRWAVEECFQAAKNETGLDHYRSAATTPGTGTPHCPCSRLPSFRSAQLKGGTSGCGQLSRTRLRHDHHGRDDVGDLIAVTAAEIRRLLTAFTHPQHPGEHYQHWSRWRRHHQAQARQSHYQRRLTNQPLPMRS